MSKRITRLHASLESHLSDAPYYSVSIAVRHLITMRFNHLLRGWKESQVRSVVVGQRWRAEVLAGHQRLFLGAFRCVWVCVCLLLVWQVINQSLSCRKSINVGFICNRNCFIPDTTPSNFLHFNLLITGQKPAWELALSFTSYTH